VLLNKEAGHKQCYTNLKNVRNTKNLKISQWSYVIG